MRQCKKNNTKIINFDDITNENIEKRNSNWLQISDHPYRIMVIRD